MDWLLRLKQDFMCNSYWINNYVIRIFNYIINRAVEYLKAWSPLFPVECARYLVVIVFQGNLGTEKKKWWEWCMDSRNPPNLSLQVKGLLWNQAKFNPEWKFRNQSIGGPKFGWAWASLEIYERDVTLCQCFYPMTAQLSNKSCAIIGLLWE